MKRTDEGSALVLALGVMILVGAISAGLLSFITTSVRARPALDVLRNREYAADAAIETAIAATRAAINTSNSNSCVNNTTLTLNGESVTVLCQDYLQPVPAPSGIFVSQRNVQFNACPSSVSCSASTAVIRAQVNFEIPAGGGSVTRTYVQSWSVLR